MNEALYQNQDVIDFVDYGEVRFPLKPDFTGRYEVTMEFFYAGDRIAVAKFTQLKK